MNYGSREIMNLLDALESTDREVLRGFMKKAIERAEKRKEENDEN